mmetsp:Transcript_8138/g.15320  ORF Transcript_8138/g.15320 Transcript_8138/m.15320 type:complete len:99 (+) Transcript_8138:218-514(+)
MLMMALTILSSKRMIVSLLQESVASAWGEPGRQIAPSLVFKIRRQSSLSHNGNAYMVLVIYTRRREERRYNMLACLNRNKRDDVHTEFMIIVEGWINA